MKKIHSRAPLRLGLAGGGTDLSPYCDKFTGYVLNVTINRYAYCTIIEETNQETVTFVSTDGKQSIALECADYPFPLENGFLLQKATFNHVIKKYNQGRPVGVKIFTYCDAPMGSGLGGSSTIVVAMVKAFEEFFKLGIDDYEIAHLAYQIERIDCALQGGKQDQYSATFGGFNFMEFYANNRVLVNPLRIRNWIQCELESSLILHFTGKSRTSANIIANQIAHLEKKDTDHLEQMHKIKNAALVMKESLLKGDFSKFFAYLNLSWESKKKSGELISNKIINDKFDMAMQAGAVAGKVSGAGGGGFIIFFSPPEKRGFVIEALKKEEGSTEICNFSRTGSQCWRV